jgi:hypothetical protein
MSSLVAVIVLIFAHVRLHDPPQVQGHPEPDSVNRSVKLTPRQSPESFQW